MAVRKSRLGRGLGNLIASGVTKGAAGKPATKAAKKNAKPKATAGRGKTVAKKATARPSRQPERSRQAPLQVEVEKTVPPAVVDAPAAEVKVQSQAAPTGEFAEIAIHLIEPNPYQPRREFHKETVAELMESIRSEGLLQPPVVRPMPEGRYQLIAGERRWRACQQLGLKTLPVRIITVSDSSSAVISLIENLQRENLNPIEESLGYASLMRDFDLTQEAVAERVGKGRASIANALRLLGLDREIQGYLSKGMLSVGHAKVILGLEESSQRLLLARRIIESGLSVREAEKQLRRIKAERSGETVADPSRGQREQTVIRDLERQISSKLNTRVVLKHTAKKGRIVIEYHGDEDLQRILEHTGLA